VQRLPRRVTARSRSICSPSIRPSSSFPEKLSPSSRSAIPILRRPPRILAGPEDQYHTASPPSVASVTASTTPPRPSHRGHPLSLDRARYTALPPTITPRVAALAARWTAAATSPLERAKAIEAELRRAYRYDLESPSGLADNPLDHFLFRIPARPLRILLHRDGGSPSAPSASHPQRHQASRAEPTPLRRHSTPSARVTPTPVEVFIEGSGWFASIHPDHRRGPSSQLAGAFAILRDLSRRPPGLEPPRQLRPRQQLACCAECARPRRHRTRRPAAALPTPHPAPLLGVAFSSPASGLSAEREPALRKPGESPSSPPPAALHAAALYRALEAALNARGVPRSPAPRHSLMAKGPRRARPPERPRDPRSYQALPRGRFGGRSLDDSERRAFLHRVRLLPRRATSQPRQRRDRPHTACDPDTVSR
jgi:hypothetical protein